MFHAVLCLTIVHLHPTAPTPHFPPLLAICIPPLIGPKPVQHLYMEGLDWWPQQKMVACQLYLCFSLTTPTAAQRCLEDSHWTGLYLRAPASPSSLPIGLPSVHFPCGFVDALRQDGVLRNPPLQQLCDACLLPVQVNNRT